MKAWPWPNILALMGKAGEGSMVSLVVDCGIFVAVDGGYGTYHQLSGSSMSPLL
jgi:telomerase reverse transcriptase